jgi:hypothetical protein
VVAEMVITNRVFPLISFHLFSLNILYHFSFDDHYEDSSHPITFPSLLSLSKHIVETSLLHLIVHAVTFPRPIECQAPKKVHNSWSKMWW